MLQQQQSNSKISFIANSVVKSVNGGSKVESLTLFNSKTNSESQIVVDGVFVEMGYIAKTDIVKDLVQLNSNQEIVVDKYCATSRRGIYAAGDVTDVPSSKLSSLPVKEPLQPCLLTITSRNWQESQLLNLIGNLIKSEVIQLTS